MTKALLLAGVLAVAGVVALAGGVLFLVGLFRKQRGLASRSALAVLAAVVVIVGGGAYVSLKAIKKIGSADYLGMWRAVVDEAFDDTAVPPLPPAAAKKILGDLLGDTIVLQGVEVQGVFVEGVVLNYGYFMYTADTRDILRAVAAAPADSTWSISPDTACRAVAWAEAGGAMMYARGPQRNLPGWTPAAVTDKRCYTCFRSPWAHTLVIDGRTGIIYHAVSETRE